MDHKLGAELHGHAGWQMMHKSGLTRYQAAKAARIEMISQKMRFERAANHEHKKGDSDEESIFQAVRVNHLRLAGYMSSRQNERCGNYARPDIQQ